MSRKSTKFIFITGGVVSSIGKGLSSACLGALLKARGLSVTAIKLDPYINVDPGTMSPFQHGEVFVTDDGAETDLDLGHYERFLEVPLSKKNNFTAGQVYETVISNERQGKYLGHTVQVIPHITDEIKKRIFEAAKGFDICLAEIGGTVGDIESLPFIEAIRQMRSELGWENVTNIHVTLVPYIKAAQEFKTKPTQHSVKELTGFGIQPDFVLCRSEQKLDPAIKAKISLFCNVKADHVITAHDVSNIYELPLVFHEQEFDQRVLERLNIWTGEPNLSHWKKILKTYTNPKNGRVRIAMIGKYVELVESYKSLSESLTHAAIANNCKIEISYVDSVEIENLGAEETITKNVDAILIPGGFGNRGTEGKIATVQYARENKIPFFGICLGLQMAVIEYARNVLKLPEATSREFDETTKYPVIDWMNDQKNVTNKGATMRLGSYPCKLLPDSLVHQIYKQSLIDERHRHRFEVNNSYREALAKAGLVFSGLSPDEQLVEIVEIKDHPWFVGVQFHPEFKSSPNNPHPLFKSFVSAAIEYRDLEANSRKASNKKTAETTEGLQIN